MQARLTLIEKFPLKRGTHIMVQTVPERVDCVLSMKMMGDAFEITKIEIQMWNVCEEFGAKDNYWGFSQDTLH